VTNSEELDELLLAIQRLVDEKKWKHVEIRPVSCQPSKHVGFGVSLAYQFHRLDLRRGANELFRTFHKDCVQRKIRRAEREGLKYDEGNSALLLGKFYKLVVMTRWRQCLPPQPFYWFRELITAFGKELKIRIASRGDLTVAGILTLSHKKSMVYKYGCSNPRYNNLGGTQLLFWKAIEDAVDNGMEEFDMGRSDTDNTGLVAFKEHWGATGSVLKYWTYPNKPQVQRPAWQRNVAQKVVSATPNAVLQAVGTLLYRHIG
jgi:lipid II:glycine glycyltransferase (peptidoglycan interpeptide bridge formation enzyme)